VRILLAAIRCEKGAVETNLARHLEILAEASAGGCDLAVFPEMSLTGSVDPAVRPERMMSLDDPAVAALAAASTGTAACFGIAESAPDGAAHITQIFAAGGRVTGVQRKRHLGDGEESFTPASQHAVFDHAGTRLGIAICAEAGYDDPFESAATRGAQLVVFPAAPGLYGRRTDEASWQAGFDWWEGSSLGDACRHARRLGLWIALAGQAGETEDEDFPGFAALVGPDGEVVSRLPDWREATLIVDVPV
jgi:NAD+ synthase (glutamine-hydrolysing)